MSNVQKTCAGRLKRYEDHGTNADLWAVLDGSEGADEGDSNA
jgi:hypothetical protein